MHSLNILLETQKNSTVYIKNNVQNLAGVKGLIKGLKGFWLLKRIIPLVPLLSAIPRDLRESMQVFCRFERGVIWMRWRAK